MYYMLRSSACGSSPPEPCTSFGARFFAFVLLVNVNRFAMGADCRAGSESDWVLDLVATGFSKPESLFGLTLQTNADIDAAADAFSASRGQVC